MVLEMALKSVLEGTIHRLGTIWPDTRNIASYCEGIQSFKMIAK